MTSPRPLSFPLSPSVHLFPLLFICLGTLFTETIMYHGTHGSSPSLRDLFGVSRKVFSLGNFIHTFLLTPKRSLSLFPIPSLLHTLVCRSFSCRHNTLLCEPPLLVGPSGTVSSDPCQSFLGRKVRLQKCKIGFSTRLGNYETLLSMS